MIRSKEGKGAAERKWKGKEEGNEGERMNPVRNPENAESCFPYTSIRSGQSLQ